MTTSTRKNLRKTAAQSSTYDFPVDEAKAKRLIKNTVDLIQQLQAGFDAVFVKTKKSRTKVLADIEALIRHIPTAQQEAAIQRFFLEVQLAFSAKATKGTKAGGAGRRPSPLARIAGQGDCLGTPGRGIVVTIDDTSIGLCETGPILNPTGGGVSYGRRY
jgi:hypothetical protein